MSAPPRPQPVVRTARVDRGSTTRFDYLPLEFADFTAIEESLATEAFGRNAFADATAAEGEAKFALTLMELSALVAHILAVHQDRYAGESFIGTAIAPSSLARHAHRLGYRPDPGLAATGSVVLFVKDGCAGTISGGLALASVPLGEDEAADYETLASLAVDARLNEITPRDAARPVSAGATALRVAGTGLGFANSEIVALVGASHWQALVISAVNEDAGADTTTLTLATPLGAVVTPDPNAIGDDAFRILAKPALTLRPFGWGADPVLYPPANLRSATATKPSSMGYWYDTGGAAYSGNDVYLSQEVPEPLAGRYVVRVAGADRMVLKVTQEASLTLSFNSRQDTKVATHTASITPIAGGGFTTSLTAHEITVPSETHIAAPVTAIRVVDRATTAQSRAAQPMPALWLTGWQQTVPLATTEPNPVALGPYLDLDGTFSQLAPGRTLIFSNRDGTVIQAVTVVRAEVSPVADVTRVYWDPFDPTPPGGWIKSDLVIYGNVARVSHGAAVSEVLGGSDGVTPFQRFPLKRSPVTMMPTANGAAPALAVRIGGIRWQLVEDFYASDQRDRHYCFELDETQAAAILFGDGRNGAIPPAGRKNVTADYRVGLGADGDVGVGRLTRIKRAHPLLDRAVNVNPVSGGTEPAGADDIRTQAMRTIRTFDRAVSGEDYADLALQFEGVARATARLAPDGGIVLVAATARGEAPEAASALRAFLDARRDTTMPLNVIGPTPRAVRLAVTIDAHPDYLPEDVKVAVRDALHGGASGEEGFFTFARRGLGQSAFLSEVYAMLEGLPGVANVNVTRFEAGTAGAVFDVVQVAADGWLRLDPNDLAVLVGTEALV